MASLSGDGTSSGVGTVLGCRSVYEWAVMSFQVVSLQEDRIVSSLFGDGTSPRWESIPHWDAGACTMGPGRH